MHLPQEQMQFFYDYFDSGKPLIALRTANHGFWGGLKYKKEGKNVSLRKMLGGTFMGHHGGWHREATRGVIVPENREHPILLEWEISGEHQMSIAIKDDKIQLLRTALH